MKLEQEIIRGLKTYRSSEMSDDTHLYGLGYAKNGKIITYHVTDNPHNVINALKSGKNISETRDEGLVGDLGTPGLYVSDAPQIWTSRARAKWDFLKSLTPNQEKALTSKLHSELQRELKSHYITEGEYEAGLMDLKQGGEVLVLLAGQPYNIAFWKPEYLESLGIKSGAQPLMIEVQLEGKFADISDVSFIYMSDLTNATAKLKSHGYDGMFTKGGMGIYPQGVIWNSQAIVKFGDLD